MKLDLGKFKPVNNDENSRLISKAYRLEETKKVPLWLHARCQFLTKWLGFDPERYYGDVRVMLQSQMEFRRKFRGIGTVSPDYGVGLLPSAFGARVIWPEGWVEPLIDSLDELENFVDGLTIPDPRCSGYLPAFYNAYFYMKNQMGDMLEPVHPSLGPFDIAGCLIGVTNILMATKQYPGAVHKLLDIISDFLIQAYECDAEMFGLDKIDTVYLGEDMPGFLSRDGFKEFVLPYTRKVFDAFESEDTINVWHCDGKLGHLLDLIPEMKVNVLYNFDPETDLEPFVQTLGGKVCLVGNLDPVNVLRNGTPEQVRDEAMRQLKIGGRYPGYVLAPGGEMPEGVPEENILAMIEALESYYGEEV